MLRRDRHRPDLLLMKPTKNTPPSGGMFPTTGCGHPKPAHATQKPTSAGGGADRICALFQCKPSRRLRGTTFNGPARNLETLQGGPANRRRWGGGTTKHHTKQAHERSFPCDTQRPDSVVKYRLGCTVGMTHRQMCEATMAPQGCSPGQWSQLMTDR